MGQWRLGSANRSIRLMLSGLLCIGLVCGCGGGGGTEENKPRLEEPDPFQRGGPKPKQRQKLSGTRGKEKRIKRRKSTAKRSPKRVKPAGVPIAPLEEDQFVVVGNADDFELVEEPFGETGKMIAALPDPGLTSSDFELVKPGPSDKSRPSIPIPKGYDWVRSAGVTQDGWPRQVICLQDQSQMVLIPAGVFQQGTSSGPETAMPEHQVHLDAFYIDMYEVTHAQYDAYREFLRANKKRVPTELETVEDNTLPATGVRWGEAMAYARWVGKELPTEAEWEKAARGSESFQYPWGNGKPVWHRPRIPGQIDPIRSFRGDQSTFGVWDMAGNAHEWCQDWYSPDAYAVALKRADGSTLRNPDGPQGSSGTKRVIRGGTDGWELWRRNGAPMGDRSPTIGFRCVLRVNQAKSAEEEEEKKRKKTGGF